MAERLITDIGGQPDGEVPRQEVPQLFWEKHMIAMFNVLWTKGVFNLDEFRRMVEQTPPEEYKHSTFYGRRVDGMAELLIEKGIVDEKELAARTQKIAGRRNARSCRLRRRSPLPWASGSGLSIWTSPDTSARPPMFAARSA